MTAVFDISRLIARADRPTPTGIDRFELHYAKWVTRRLGDRVMFVETTALGPRLVDNAYVQRLIDEIRSRWEKPIPRTVLSQRLRYLAAAIDGEVAWNPSKSSTKIASKASKRILGRLRSFAAASVCPPQIIDPALIHVSHTRLDKKSAFAWLGPGRRGLFYVHDLIPLSHPAFVRAGEPAKHLQRIRTILNYGRLVLCNSRVTQSAFTEQARRLNMHCPATLVAAPGVEDIFLQQSAGARVETRRPYFVCVGTIEPRKNHALLLDLWHLLAERRGKETPRLVIAGRRGWAQPELLSRLDVLGSLGGLVFEVSDLDDGELASLIAGATGLLAPSFVEGYDMPVLEALALGTPVIASDIGAHRETVGAAATLISPGDCQAWLAVIDSHVSYPRRAAKQHFRTWRQHFTELDGLLSVTPIAEHRSDTASQHSLGYRYGR
jgi:glycosyltransferase involved in cell wall biosynthesis